LRRAFLAPAALSNKLVEMLHPQSLYISGNSRVHHLHPLTKLVYTLSVVLVVFLGPDRWLSVLLTGLLSMLIAGWAGLIPQMLRTLARTILPLAAMLLIIHGLFNPANNTPFISVGPLSFGEEGLSYAALIIGRLVSVLAASLLLVFSTRPGDLILALSQAGLSPWMAYLLGSPLLLLPQLRVRANSIHAAQRARGLETEGSLLKRARALFPLVAPLVYSALVDTEERAMALEARAFSASGPKTSLVELVDTIPQRVARWGMLIFAVLLAMVGAWWRVRGYP
jgi:energy-coupling factor transport system permease protein